MPKFLFLSATNNNNLKLAQQLAEIALSQNIDTEIVALEPFRLPLYSPEMEAEMGKVPDIVCDLVNKIKEADALIFLAPEYNGSIPPVVTNTICWISRTEDDWRSAFNGKPMVVGTHSGGAGFKVLENMRSMLNHLGALVIARTFATNYQKAQNPDSARAIFYQLKKLCS